MAHKNLTKEALLVYGPAELWKGVDHFSIINLSTREGNMGCWLLEP